MRQLCPSRRWCIFCSAEVPAKWNSLALRPVDQRRQVRGDGADCGACPRWLEFQHRIDAGVVSRQRAGYCLGRVAALRSSTVSMGFGSIRRRCTSNAKHSSATSLGRERDRPVCFSIRRNRWRTVLGWQISTSAAPRTDASLFSHTRNVSNSVSRSSSGRSPKPSSAAPAVLIIAAGALTAAVARIEPSNTATEEVESVGPRTITFARCNARGVSRRSSKGAHLHPPAAVVETAGRQPCRVSVRRACARPTYR